MARRSAERLVAQIVSRRRAGLLHGTALQAAGAIVFVTGAAAQPAPNARPIGGTVVAGAASIGRTSSTTTITQSSQRAAIDWRSFDVGSQQTVNFAQPNSSALTLNRVAGPDPSAIAGRINANGGIIITNPAGVVFHQGAQVNATNLVVSAPGITNHNFMAGKLVFDQPAQPNATVSNAGTITVKQTGLAALVAPRVINSGTINARLGRVVLAGAAAHTIDLYGDGLLSIDVTKSVAQVPRGPDGKPVTALVTNTGTVIADGGTVQITAAAADGIIQTLVDAGGRIQANTVGTHTGRVAIAGVGGSVLVEGQVTANGGVRHTGGQIAVAATDTVTVGGTAKITANGGTGGGTIALGTTIARAKAGRAAALSASLPSPGAPAGTAKQVLVAAGATVSADATGAGPGGTITALSTALTHVSGQLTARGGPQGGDGGVVELSSIGPASSLQIDVWGNVSAPMGKGGTIFLDPFDVVIGTGSPAATFNPFSDPATASSDPPNTGTSFISPAQIQSASEQGASNIRIQAANDLLVQESLNLALGTSSTGGGNGVGASLSLEAGHDLTVSANITLGQSGVTGGTLPSLTLIGGHQIFLQSGASNTPIAITTQGDVSLLATAQPGDSLASSITIRNGVTIDTQSGIIARAAGRIDLVSNVTLNAGPGTSATAQQTAIDMQAGSEVTVSNATVVNLRSNAGSVRPLLQFVAGDNFQVSGTGTTLNGGALGTTLVAAGSALPSTNIPTAPAATATGSLSFGPGTAVTGPSVQLTSGASGGISLQGGSSVTSQTGTLTVNSGTVGTAADGTIDAGSGRVTLSSSGPVTQASSGAIIANRLSGSASSFQLTSRSNRIDTIGAISGDTLRASSGDILLVDSVNLAVGDTGSSVGGGIVVGSGRQIGLTTDSLTVGNGSVTAVGIDQIFNAAIAAPAGKIVVQPYSPAQAVELIGAAPKTAGSLSLTQAELGRMRAGQLQLGSSAAGPATISGQVDVGAPGSGGNGFTTLSLQSGSTITQASGSTLAAGTLLASGTSVNLGNPGNQIGNLGLSSASAGDFSLASAASALVVTDSVTVPTGQTLSLTADTIGFGEGGTLAAPGGTIALAPLTSGTTIALESFVPSTAALTADTLRVGSTSTGAITIAAGFVLSNINTLDLQAAGAITESGAGSLQVSQLTGSAGSAALNGANQVGTLGAFTTSTGFSFTNARGLTVAGPVTDGTRIALNVTGDLALTGSLSAPTVDMVSTGAITQGTAGITAGLLTGSASAVTLTSSQNRIDAIGPFTATEPFSVTDARSLTIAGAITASPSNGSIAFTVDGDLAVNNLISADLVSLTATKAITEGSAGQVVATALGGKASQVTLNGANQVTALASWTSSNGFAFNNAAPLSEYNISQVNDLTSIDITTAGTLMIIGSMQAPSVTLTANRGGPSLSLPGDIASSGSITANTLTLMAADTITQSGGAIAAGTLTGSSGGATQLTSASNAIGTLGAFSSVGGFQLTNGTDLSVSGPVTDAAFVGLNVTGALTLNGTVHAPSVNLAATGAVDECSCAAVVATTLTGSAASATLTAGGNQVDQLSGYATAGDFSLVDSVPLAVVGTVKVGQGRTLSLESDSIQLQAESSLLAPGGTVAFAPFTPGQGFALGSFVPSGNITADTLRVGSATTGDITISGTFNLSGINTLDLRSGASITESAGAELQVARLTGAAQSATLNGNNQIGELAGFATATGFVLNDTSGLNVTGLVTDSASIQLTTTGDLALGGSVSAPTVLLSVQGAITQSAGALTAGTLSGSAASVSLTSANNSITTFGSFASTGAVALTDGHSLTISSVTASDATLIVAGDLVLDGLGRPFGTAVHTASLTASGNISEGTNGLNVGTLTGSAGGSANFSNSASITTLGAFSSQRGLTISTGNGTYGQPLTVTGPVSDPSSISITTSGTLTIAGDIAAPSVKLESTGFDMLGHASFFDPTPILQTSGTIRARDTLSLVAAGQIRQSGGVIITDSLSGGSGGSFGHTSYGSSSYGVSLTSSGNQIGALGPFTNAGGVNLTTATSLNVTGTISDNIGITLNAAGPLALAGSIQAPTVSLAAGTISQTSGSIQASTLTGSAQSAQFGQAANQISQLGAFTTAGDLTVVDGTALSVNGAVVAGSGHTISLFSDAISIGAGGSMAAPGGIVALAPLTSGTPFALSSALAGSSVTADTLRVGSAATGDIGISGTFNLSGVNTLDLRSAGAVTESAGASLQVAQLTGGAASATLDQANAIGELGPFSTTGSLTLVNGTALTVAGPVDAPTLSISAAGTLILAGGQFTTNKAMLSVTAGADGSAVLQQTATTSFSPTSATVAKAAVVSGVSPITLTQPTAVGTEAGSTGTGTLTLGLPSAGGSMILSNLNAAPMAVTLNLGSGTAMGTLTAASLQVNGSGGSAALFGTVAGQSGFAAASAATIAPSFNAAYQFNNCAISATCGVPIPTPTPTPTPVVTPITTPAMIVTEPAPLVTEPFLLPSTVTPKSFLDATLGGQLKTNLFIADLITIGIVRDPADPDLLLPNISDRDY